ncbi:hypothetical protein N566_11540 [Streptomycetaceae bacterium MP113-05]|nr:hypothetical protein N566_11540 [Streptomycetaceae bacterium MP113-05]
MSFIAEPEAVGAVRHRVGEYFRACGLGADGDVARLCVSELVTNVVLHVGVGTNVTLRVSRVGPRMRIEVTDPAVRTLPLSMTTAEENAESGRGLAILGAMAERWGVTLAGREKTVWCEIGPKPAAAAHPATRSCDRAESALELYRSPPGGQEKSSQLSRMYGQETAVALISDVLRWLTAQGEHPDDILDKALMHLEAEAL